MTRDQQIAAALKVLEPPRGKGAACRRDLEAALRWVEKSTEAKAAHKVSRSKKGKKRLESYKKALERALARRAKVDPANIAPINMVSRWFRADLHGDIVQVEKLLARPPPKKRDAIKIKEAKDVAHKLLEQWGHKPVTTRKGNWDQLTKALAGIDAAAPSLHGHLCNPKPMVLARGRNATAMINASEEARRFWPRRPSDGDPFEPDR